jgi:hypothetical protein
MHHDLVLSDQIIKTKNFIDTPPTLSANKGKWLEQVISDVEIDGNTQKKELNYVFTATESRHEYSAVPLTQAELDEVSAQAMTRLRSERNFRLYETDFYALSDVTMTADMSTYRQDLRDLPANTTDVFNPVYPEKPE